MSDIKVEEKIKKLQSKQNEIQKKIEHLKNKDLLKNKKDEINRKIIIGSFFLEKYEKENKLNELKEILKTYLTKKRDRKLFDLDDEN